MTNETKHTEGPWILRKDGTPAFRYEIVGPENYGIALVYESAERVESDARLIAAAPELLAALRGLVDYWNQDGCSHTADVEPDCIGCYARAAIAKAEGKFCTACERRHDTNEGPF